MKIICVCVFMCVENDETDLTHRQLVYPVYLWWNLAAPMPCQGLIHGVSVEQMPADLQSSAAW